MWVNHRQLAFVSGDWTERKTTTIVSDKEYDDKLGWAEHKGELFQDIKLQSGNESLLLLLLGDIRITRRGGILLLAKLMVAHCEGWRRVHNEPIQQVSLRTDNIHSRYQ